MKIYLITKEKKVIVKEANNRYKFWTWNEGSYRLDSSCVRLSMKSGGINPNAELIFTENSPLPINSVIKEDTKMFDEVILKNALESVAHVDRGSSIFNWFKDLNSEKIVMWITLACLGIYLLYTYTHGGFK